MPLIRSVLQLLSPSICCGFFVDLIDAANIVDDPFQD
jgi:hypothetical protein